MQRAMAPPNSRDEMRRKARGRGVWGLIRNQEEGQRAILLLLKCTGPNDKLTTSGMLFL